MYKDSIKANDRNEEIGEKLLQLSVALSWVPWIVPNIEAHWKATRLMPFNHPLELVAIFSGSKS